MSGPGLGMPKLVEVLIWSETRERAAAKATVAYAIP